ncbi:CPBP family intramembrane metalloprotease [Paenibacillus albidus]|uniref:CPBP family glutamic-type intramembrane protease n=1 Tax=Paenibacillus albidus TaxID=2041023 RepID=UPI001BE76896|nr:CPBP family intramembrane metalloprotease [Paenibacillus albidus]
MLLNIIIPSLVFGWIYFVTDNLLVPVIAHIVMNLVMGADDDNFIRENDMIDKSFESPAKMGGADMESAGGLFQGQTLIIVVIDEMGDMGDALIAAV